MNSAETTTVKIDKKLHDRLRVMAAKRQTTIKALLERAAKRHYWPVGGYGGEAQTRKERDDG